MDGFGECASTQINDISLGGTLIAKQIGKSTFTTDTGARMAEGTLGFNPFANPYEGATPGQADGTHGNAGGNGNGNAGGNGNGNAGGNGNGAGGNADPNAVATTAVVSPETYSVEYVHTDALGSPVSYTSSTGSVLPYRNTRYEPYGTPTTTPRDGEPTYTGHQYDTGTGLIYAQARYYDPALGRFLSPDPIAVDTTSAFNFNRYAYANNSPYKFTDPDGREVDCVNCDDAVASAGIFAGGQMSDAGTERVRYSAEGARLAPTDTAGRSALKADSRARTPSMVRAAVEAARPSTAAKLGSGGRANVSNAKVNSLANGMKIGGRVLVAAAAAQQVNEIATSSDPAREVAGAGGMVAGAVGGGEAGVTAGATIGAVLGGPPGAGIGAIFGGLVGSSAGGIGGEMAAEAVYDRTRE